MAVGRGTARAYGYLPVGTRNQEEHRQHALEAESTKKVHLFYYHNVHVIDNVRGVGHRVGHTA